LADPTRVTIRPAAAADEGPVLALMEQLFEAPGHPAPGYTPERGRTGFRSAVENPNADVLLAFDGGQLIGLASVYADVISIRYGPRCWLQDLVVRKDQRRRGIGRMLLDAATEWARAHGCTHLELSSGSGRTEAHRFYLREGMTQSLTFQRWIE
jgi:GNAT superfamily N-acetyltransferase